MIVEARSQNWQPFYPVRLAVFRRSCINIAYKQICENICMYVISELQSLYSFLTACNE